MDKILKKRLIYIVKISITLVILFFIFRKIDFQMLLFTFKQIKLWIIAVIILTTCIKILIEYRNWGYYLKIDPQYSPSKSEIFRSLMIGHSLRFLLPGGHGVIGKMYFVNNKKMMTFMSLGVEKFFQIWINFVFASFASIFYFRHKSIVPTILIFVFILAFPFLVYLIKHIKYNSKFDVYFKQYLKIVPRICYMQGIYMALTILQYYLILNIFSEFHPFSAIISIPLILFANVIPITYAGLGLREKFAMEVLSKYNISPEIAITASLTVFIFNSVLPALVGVYCILRKKSIST